MDRIDEIVNEACEEQRAALREYHRTGSGEALAAIHSEACLACDRALDAVIALRGEERRPPEPRPGNRLPAIMMLAGIAIAALAAVGALGYVMIRPFFATVDASELSYAERTVRFVRVPGNPNLCVAQYPGKGGFGPMILGAAPCGDVSARVESGEGIADGLRGHAVVRIRGTGMCLAHAPRFEDDFVFPCGD